MIARPIAIAIVLATIRSPRSASSDSRMCGTWARKIRIASALTNPSITDRGTNRINSPTPSAPRPIWKMPARMVAANRYSMPCSSTSGTSTSAIAPVAAEIMPGRPPAKAMMIAIENEAYRPTFGSTPAMIENEIASGMSASATTRPESRLAFGFSSHSRRSNRARAAVGMVMDIDASGDVGDVRGAPGRHEIPPDEVGNPMAIGRFPAAHDQEILRAPRGSGPGVGRTVSSASR